MEGFFFFFFFFFCLTFDLLFITILFKYKRNHRVWVTGLRYNLGGLSESNLAGALPSQKYHKFTLIALFLTAGKQICG